jgi:sigma-B regulation protein RsbU (phosphoserine phosphatase)
VSGDFYDFIPLQHGLWGMLIADVADKGTPAALFMAVCRTLLRAAAVSRTSPAATLARVNELLFNDAPTDLFVTVFYAVWDPATGKIAYASGGHNPPLLVPASGDVRELKCRGIALSVVPSASFDEREVTLKPGDALVAYTDGVSEAMQEDYTEYGVDRLKEAVNAARGQAAATMLDSVLVDIENFVGGAAQNDDLTLWILKRCE